MIRDEKTLKEKPPTLMLKETTKEEVEKFISELEIEADACEEIGSNFSASEMRDEAKRLERLLAKGIIPQDISSSNP